MSKGNCPECNHVVALSAYSCPGCGNTEFDVRRQINVRGKCPVCKDSPCYGTGRILPTNDLIDEYNRLRSRERGTESCPYGSLVGPFMAENQIICPNCNGSGRAYTGETKIITVDCRDN